jgi:hypothetical protein
MKKLFTLVVVLSVLSILAAAPAFAKGGGSQNNWSPPPAAVANLDCSVTPPAPPAAGTILVAGFSTSTNVTVTPTLGEQCAQALADLLTAGLKIKHVQTVGSTNIVYTLVSESD